MLLQMVGPSPLNILIHLKKSMRMILKRYFSVVNFLTNKYYFFEATKIWKFMKNYIEKETDGTCMCNSVSTCRFQLKSYIPVRNRLSSRMCGTAVKKCVTELTKHQGLMDTCQPMSHLHQVTMQTKCAYLNWVCYRCLIY